MNLFRMIVAKIVIALSCIAASVVPSSFAQSIDYLEKLMRQVLSKEAVCKRGVGASICDYDTPRFTIGLTGSDGNFLQLGIASARVRLKPPPETGQGEQPVAILQAFFKPFNFDRAAILECISKGRQRDEWQPAEVKSPDNILKLKCYGDPFGLGWTLIMNRNNEF